MILALFYRRAEHSVYKNIPDAGRTWPRLVWDWQQKKEGNASLFVWISRSLEPL